MAKRILKPKNKKHFKPGGLLSTQWGANAPNATAFGAAGAAGSSLVDTIDPQDEYGVQSTGGALASGALKGAGMGAAFGPVGALVGGAVGGITSLIGNKKAKDAKEDALEAKKKLDFAKSLQESSAILANYNNQGTGTASFRQGGVLYSYPAVWKENPLEFKKSKYTFQQGGQIPVENGDLRPISADAYEVNGDEPGLTDDVGMGDAYVDHNEVLKPDATGIKIFSDTLKPPGSNKTFAKVAKALEKQKSADGKNQEQDELIEMKLQSLFQQQQMLNGDNDGESPEEALQPAGEQPGAGMTEGNMFQAGGQMYGGISGSGITDEQEFFNLQNAMRKKKKYAHGGQLSPLLKSYHAIKPVNAGMNPGDYFASKVMSYKTGGKLHKLAESEDEVREKQLEMGIPIEAGEHHTSLTKGKTIAHQHLVEDKKYYTKLKKAGLQMGGNLPTMRYQAGGEIITGTNPRDYINQELARNYPGIDLSLLDQHNKPLNPGIMDTPAQAAIRRGYTPDGRPSTQLAAPMTGQGLLPPGKSSLVPTQVSSPLVAETKPNYQDGGQYKLTQNELMAGVDPRDKLLGRQVATEADLARFAEPTQNPSKKFDWNTALTSAGTLAPTFANMTAARKLPQAPMVHLNKSVNLRTPDFSDARNDLKQGLRAGLLASQQNSAMGQAQTGQAGLLTGQYFNASNRLQGDINRQKTDIYNRQAGINADIGARNNALLDQYAQAQAARGSNIIGLQSQNRADLANKILGLTAQENQKLSDKQKSEMLMAFLNKQGGGLGTRNADITDAYLKAAGGKKRGGKVLYRKGGKLRMRVC